MITADGRTMCLQDWAIERGLTHSAILKRIAEGMSEEDAVLTPRKKG